MLSLLNRGGGVQWLVVFLGNPGAKYEKTRHNIGFMAAEACEREESVRIDRLRFRALTAQLKLGDQGVLLMKPQTFMNLSGEAASQAAKFYKVPPEKVIVISDDVSMSCGKLRIRTKGSAGGHNGLKSIIACLGSDEFPRIKVGVGAPPHPDYDMADWVLGCFSGQDAKAAEQAAARAWEAAKVYITEGPDRAMNKFSQK